MSVRNEELYLPGFFNHIRPYVDGFILLNDRSTDRTSKLIHAEENATVYESEAIDETTCVIKDSAAEFGKPVTFSTLGGYYNERAIRQFLVRAASANGYNVVLCADADERFESRFLAHLKSLATLCYKKNLVAGLHFRELWGDVRHWRSDGLWGEKMKYILFPLMKSVDTMTFSETMKHTIHTYWFYDQINNSFFPTEYNLYHLKMISANDRVKRSSLYKALDPHNEMQPIGYDYLTDESGICLTEVTEEHSYALDSVPPMSDARS